ncbi:MAG: hypothetical protein ACJ719_14320 [Nitrososphaeraceae archaeon]
MNDELVPLAILSLYAACADLSVRPVGHLFIHFLSLTYPCPLFDFNVVTTGAIIVTMIGTSKTNQMDQEEQDQHDLQLFHEQKQEEEEEVCPGHEYEFLEPLPSGEPDVFKDLYICIICSHQHVITHHTGIRG